MNQKYILQPPIIPPQIIPLIRKASQTSVPVLILGEQGIGKQWVARTIHHLGEWKHHRFQKIDCKMLKGRTLFSLFAYLFREIRYGSIPATVFCKEVGYLDHWDQLKLLELIEECVFDYNGEKRVVKNIRWIGSSSEDLREKAKQRNFSGDLYDCLNAISIYLPPLRDRIKEIPTIVRYLLAEHATRMGLRTKGVSQNVLFLLQSYWWPGNLKELEGVILRSAVYSEGENVMEKDLFSTARDENNLFFNYLEGTKFKTPFEKNNTAPCEVPSIQWIPFLAELVQRIKNPLVSINTFTKMFGEKFNDSEFRESFYKVVTNDIERIDFVLNGVLNYIRMNTPLNKSKTINQLLEEILKRYEPHFEERHIKIFKKLQNDLPETMIYEEQVRYIFHTLIQYALSVLPPRGIFGLLTKVGEEAKQSNLERTGSDKGRERIEILMVLTGVKKTIDKYETIFGISSTQSEETEELELKLIHDIVNKNKGKMTVEVNEKKPRTLISLRFPIERRKIIYYAGAYI